MSAPQFMELLFGKLPESFQDEQELRDLGSVPETSRAVSDGHNYPYSTYGDSGLRNDPLSCGGTCLSSPSSMAAPRSGSASWGSSLTLTW